MAILWIDTKSIAVWRSFFATVASVMAIGWHYDRVGNIKVTDLSECVEVHTSSSWGSQLADVATITISTTTTPP